MKMLKTKSFGLLVFLSLVSLFSVEAQNYCNATLCKSGRKHIACNNNGAFAANCGTNPRIITMTTALQKRILNNHNTKRNQLAGGKLPNYSAARRMASMQWSAELAKLAVLNVKQCVMKHDQCRNTNAFPLAGQNLAYTYWSGTTRTVEQILDQHMQLWWDEYKHCSMSYINNYRAPPQGSKQIGHFTQMAQERATHVGCGILRVQRGTQTYQYTACNYAFTNILDRAVYRSGVTANLCKTGRNIYYNNLCKISEVYNVKSANYNN